MGNTTVELCDGTFGTWIAVYCYSTVIVSKNKNQWSVVGVRWNMYGMLFDHLNRFDRLGFYISGLVVPLLLCDHCD